MMTNIVYNFMLSLSLSHLVVNFDSRILMHGVFHLGHTWKSCNDLKILANDMS